MFKKSALIISATLVVSAIGLSSLSSAATVGGPRGKSNDGPTRTEKFRPPKLNLVIAENGDDDGIHYKRFKKKSNIEISCKEGKQIVARQGFEAVRTLKCEGRNFKYLAYFDGNLLRVDVNRHGDIVGAWNF